MSAITDPERIVGSCPLLLSQLMRLISPTSVCHKPPIKPGDNLWNGWLAGYTPGTNQYRLLSDLDRRSRSLEVGQNRSLFANNRIHHYCRQPQQNLQRSLFNSLSTYRAYALLPVMLSLETVSPRPHLTEGVCGIKSPRNAHLRNFQHYFTISLHLHLSILLPN